LSAWDASPPANTGTPPPVKPKPENWLVPVNTPIHVSNARNQQGLEYVDNWV